MAQDEQHPRDALQDALDERLDPERLAEVEAHVRSCDACRRELEALRWTKAQARSARGASLPPDLEASLRGALDAEDRTRRAARPRSRLRALAPWLAAAAAAAAAIWMGGRLRSGSIPVFVAAELRAHRSGALPRDVESEDPEELQEYFLGSSLPFPMKVYDLGMMAYRLDGAAVRPVRGRPAALVAYRGPEGLSLLCRMYQGSLAELPEPAERRTNGGIAFHVYRDADVTLVFWEEGAVVCVLAGDGDPEAVVQLAFAKAVRV
jgi:anti-sigma factor RsiW